MSPNIITYDIKRWDGINTLTSPAPAIYIIPDKKLMNQVRNSNYEIPIKISGTNSYYDNNLVMAKCQPSQNTAGYRPNFQSVTNAVVLVLDMDWEGYPDNLGQVHILEEYEDEGEAGVTNYLKKLVNNSKTDMVLPYCVISIIFLIVMLLLRCRSISPPATLI